MDDIQTLSLKARWYAYRRALTWDRKFRCDMKYFDVALDSDFSGRFELKHPNADMDITDKTFCLQHG